MKPLNAYVVLVAIVIICLLSCDSDRPQEQNVSFKDVDLTTEELQAPDSKSYSRRKTENIVEHLYHQALQRDSALEALDSRIEQIWSVQQDSMLGINDFFAYNNAYYESLERYLSSIKDSSKRLVMREYFNVSKKNYDTAIGGLGDASDVTRDLAVVLADQHTMIKLIVSERLMRAYQKKMPMVHTIDGLNEQYREVIGDAYMYTKIVK